MVEEISKELLQSIQSNGLAGSAKMLCRKETTKVSMNANQMLNVAKALRESISSTRGDKVMIDIKSIKFIESEIERLAKSTVLAIYIVDEALEALPLLISADILNQIKKNEYRRISKGS